MATRKQIPRADGSYALEVEAEQQLRRDRLNEPHVAPLTAFARTVRSDRGCADAVPFFDPRDGGVTAEALLLMEAPGPKSRDTGFVSRDNPDPSARNLRALLAEAGIERHRTALWNIVPWYIGTGTRIRPAAGSDVKAGASYLEKLLPLFPNLSAIVLHSALSTTLPSTSSSRT